MSEDKSKLATEVHCIVEAEELRSTLSDTKWEKVQTDPMTNALLGKIRFLEEKKILQAKQNQYLNMPKGKEY